MGHTILRNVTFTERLGPIPGAVLGADESGGPVGIHHESRRTLEGDGVVVGEVTSNSHPVGWHSRVTTVDDCANPKACILLSGVLFSLPCQQIDFPVKASAAKYRQK